MRIKTDHSFVNDTTQTLGKSYLEPTNFVLGMFDLGSKQVNTLKVEKEAEKRFQQQIQLNTPSSFLGKAVKLAVLAGVAYGVYTTGAINLIPSPTQVLSVAASYFGF